MPLWELVIGLIPNPQPTVRRLPVEWNVNGRKVLCEYFATTTNVVVPAGTVKRLWVILIRRKVSARGLEGKCWDWCLIRETTR